MANNLEAPVEVPGHGTEPLGVEHLIEAEARMPQLDVSIFPNLIFWLVVSIVLLYLILTKVALPRLNSVLVERGDAITGDLEQAQLYKKRAADAETAYETALAKAREESQQIAAEAKAEINKELSVLMAKANAEISAKTAESESRIAEIRDGANKSVEQIARDTAGDIVGRFLTGSVDQATVDAAISNRLKV
jgi:F-type H+-transporting ATPase subunit b